MCGRFSLSGSPDLYADYFETDQVLTEAISPSYNVAPTDWVYVVAEKEGKRSLGRMRWGLRTHWSDTASHINARMETAATRPAFRDAFRRKRCLIPADGFYEWERREGRRLPHWIFRADGYPLAFAGLWASWKDPEGDWVRSCAIVTTAAQGVVAPLHDRMPVALRPEVWSDWLDRTRTSPAEVSELLRPIDAELLMEYRVAPLVNSVKNNGSELVRPVSV